MGYPASAQSSNESMSFTPGIICTTVCPPGQTHFGGYVLSMGLPAAMHVSKGVSYVTTVVVGMKNNAARTTRRIITPTPAAASLRKVMPTGSFSTRGFSGCFLVLMAILSCALFFLLIHLVCAGFSREDYNVHSPPV